MDRARLNSEANPRQPIKQGGFMKRAIIIICLALLFGALFQATAQAATVVNFPDANLEQLVRNRLFKPIGDITDVDMLTLTDLEGNFHGIINLQGLEYATNLTYLLLWGNSISDITPVQNLTKLNYLDLYGNSISDITPVQNLTNLTVLLLGGNSTISDITPVQYLTNLTSLVLDGNSTLTDITPVQNLTNLNYLGLYGNSITDITPLVTNSLLGGLGAGVGTTSLPDTVDLRDNYLDLSPGSDDMADINVLEAAGATVAYIPQKSREPDIDVSPLKYDFGDVAWLSPSTAIVTVTNTGVGPLEVSGLNAASGPWGSTYTIDSPPLLPVTIPVGGTIDLQITYTVISLGPTSAVLEIESNDPDEGVVEVVLSGNGVKTDTPPDEQIQVILDFFDESVGKGSLVGNGQGRSANGRLHALRNTIMASGDLIQDGDIKGACQQLLDVYKRVDGIEPPPDFVSGSAAEELGDLIQKLRESLGCD